MKTKNIKGLVLLEALMAIALLSTASTVMGGILRDSVSTTALSRDYVQAYNLSTEAVESIKDIRDTNWLIHPTDNSCWLVIDPTANGVNCAASQAIEGVNYVTERTEKGSFKLVAVAGQNLDLEKNLNGATPYKLSSDSNAAIFYRSVRMTGLKKVGDIIKSASFDVLVEWKRGNKNAKIIRTFTLHNFMK